MGPRIPVSHPLLSLLVDFASKLSVCQPLMPTYSWPFPRHVHLLMNKSLIWLQYIDGIVCVFLNAQGA